jgi:hypothetical protein
VIAAAIVYQPGCKLSMRFAGESPQAVNLVDVDVVGVRVGTWVVLFHTEQTRARSALSFRVEHDDRLRFLITGLAPGGWDVWRNGWLENDTAGVEPKEAVLFFEAPAGSFFIRSLN